MSLGEDQIKRYSRQIILPYIGKKGQEKLLKSKVLIIGAGGLGSPCAIYLACAGMGRLGIVDSDAVELSNLQRQILHSTKDIGRPKAESAKERLCGINTDVEVIPYQIRLTSENILELIKDYDIIVDGSDNFSTRYLVNDACIILKRPLSHGSIFRFEGQAITIIPDKSPCYRCLFPEPSPPQLTPSSQEAGVLGVVSGVIGVIQANEVLKYILGIGELLTGRLLVFNSLDSSFKIVKVPKDPRCPVCGKNPTLKKLANYREFCQLPKK